MVGDAKFNIILSELSQQKISRVTLATLGETIFRMFPESSPIRSAYENLANRFENPAPDDVQSHGLSETTKLTEDFRSIAAAALKFVENSSPVDGGNDQRTLQAVNQAFYDSTLFQVTKWILAISLGLIGAGSLGYAGINLVVFDRIQAAQQRVSESTNKFNEYAKSIDEQRAELKKKQDDALKDVQDAIQQQSAKIDKKFQEVMTSTMSNWNETLKKAGEQVKSQSGNLADATIAAIQGAKSEVGQATKMQIAEIEKTAKDGMTQVSTAASNGSTVITQQTATEIESLKNLGNVKQREFDSAAGDRAGALNKALDAKSAEISQKLNDKRVEIQNALDQKTTDAKNAIEGKVADINTKSGDAAQRINSVVSELAASESRFTSGMKERLSFWDQSVQTQIHRLDDIAKVGSELSANQNSISTRLDALKTSSAAALEVAEKLSAGTSTDRLHLIGTILEDSSLIIAGFSACALVSLILSAINFFVWRRRSLPQAE